ncbi:MAG: Uma2 family endonuclease [Clostridiales Family XIII bacterium]|jgi:Uma2 family endonuclease|nr:Uma2 family endonuclease [Clostridiales Family XIII bacterium]
MSVALKKDEYYTYEDYYHWDTDERYELIDGSPYLMAPAPGIKHQLVVVELAGEFRDFLKDKPCKAFVAPIDIRLNADAEDDTVVQPDVLIVCDREKIDERGIRGAPDLVVEVISPSSEAYDSGVKLDRYLKAGVRECWIVNPADHIIRVYTKNSNGEEAMKAYGRDDTVQAEIFPGLSVSFKTVFDAAEF